MEFTLRFPLQDVLELAGRYHNLGEAEILEVGRRIADGEHRREHLGRIFDWKTRGRGGSRIALNSDAEIADALRLATSAKTELCALSVLTGLSGVEIPVASTVLTVVNPRQYTILDFRALFSLSIDETAYTPRFYLAYLDICRHVAREASEAVGAEVTLRKLDHALWQFSKENQKPGKSLIEAGA
ncbi:hypothetical protein ACVIGB_001025 [Bradyrhizobium sp. USDA 4341]